MMIRWQETRDLRLWDSDKARKRVVQAPLDGDGVAIGAVADRSREILGCDIDNSGSGVLW